MPMSRASAYDAFPRGADLPQATVVAAAAATEAAASVCTAAVIPSVFVLPSQIRFHTEASPPRQEERGGNPITPDTGIIAMPRERRRKAA